MTSKTNNEWEKEFDKKFLITSSSGYSYFIRKSGLIAKEEVEIIPQIKSFIQNLLSSERQRLREEIEKMKKGLQTKNHFRGCNPYCHDSGQDQALSDILKLLEE